MRAGLIARKMGMTRVFTENGEHIPVTVLQVENCQVVAQRTPEKDGYHALQLGVGKAKVKRVSKAMRGHFAKAEVEPKAKVVEFPVSEDCMIDVGAELSVEHFVPGQYVDVVGTSIGKGFAGAMKRHNFSGLRASHGVSISHRSHGSTGHSQDPGKVFKGKKMAGHMGDARVSVQNLSVVRTVPEDGLLLIRGAVPGHDGSWILVSDAVKKAVPDEAPVPGAIRAAQEAKVDDAEAAAAPTEQPEAQAEAQNAPVEAPEGDAGQAEKKED